MNMNEGLGVWSLEEDNYIALSSVYPRWDPGHQAAYSYPRVGKRMGLPKRGEVVSDQCRDRTTNRNQFAETDAGLESH